MPRRFPAPWIAERIPGGYVVKDAVFMDLLHTTIEEFTAADASGQALVYVYARETANEANIVAS